MRTHRASEVAYLKDQAVGLAIMGTREVAFVLLRYALSRFGLPDDKVQAIVQTARASGEGGALEREPDIELPEAIPEFEGASRRRPATALASGARRSPP